MIPFVLITLFSAASFADAANRSFPDDFLLGVASSAHQIEGAWNEDGKGENIWDYTAHKNRSYIWNEDTADIACDSYHKYREDVELAASMGLGFYRFSIAWSRVLPTGFADQINEIGVQYYQNLTNLILAYNMIPVVTLYHWDLPQPLQEIGGFNNPLIVQYFTDYARVMIQSLEGVQYWSTFNEPKQVCLLSYGKGIGPPLLRLSGQADYLCSYYLLKAHASAYHMFKEEFRNNTGKMGMVIDGQWAEPASDSEADVEAAERNMHFELGTYANPIFNGNWPQVMIDRIGNRSEQEGLTSSRLPQFTQEEIEDIQGTADYFGFNHYFTFYVADANESAYGTPSYDKDMRVTITRNSSWPTGSNGNTIVPWGFRKYLKRIKETYGNPDIFVTENGISDDGSTLDDDIRINFYQEYLNAMLDAIEEDEVKVFAYAAWSLLDNFEWIFGYSHHFGFYQVDMNDDNRPRRAKKSASWFTNVTTTMQISTTSSKASDVIYASKYMFTVIFIVLKKIL